MALRGAFHCRRVGELPSLESPQMTDNTRGAVLMMLGMAAFVFSDATMKLLGQSLPLFQSLFLRGLLVTALFWLLARYRGALAVELGDRDRRLLIWRVASEALTAFFFFMALFNMPLANVTAILQALPLTITLAGALFLGERVGWRRASMIALGFLGVLMIVRPGTAGFDHHAIYALLAVACVTLRDIVTRQMSVSVPSVAVAFWTALGVTVFAALGSLTESWVTPGPSHAGLLVLASGFILAGYLLAIMAVRIGELAAVSPFRYTGLIWALILGFLVFGDWPDGMTMLGAGLIVVSGLYSFFRERQLSRQSARTRPASTP